MDVNKTIPVQNRTGSLENKIDNISQLINQYKNLNGKSEPTTLNSILKEGISLFEGNFRNIVSNNDYNIQSKSSSSEDIYKVFENSCDSFLEFSPEGIILSSNSKAKNLLDPKEKGFKDLTIYSFIKEEYISVIEHWISPYIREKNPLKSIPMVDNLLLLQLSDREGSIKSVEGHIEAYKKNGAPVFGLALRIISSRGDLKSKLQRVESNYDALSETVNEVILRIDENFNIIYSNSSVRSIFGYSVDEVINQHLSLIFPPEILKRHEKDLLKYFYLDSESRAEMGLENSIEILGRHKNRGVSPMEISFGNAKENEERILTCIVRDITLRKNAERKLHKLAYFDKLTNLGNRDHFQRDMNEHIQSQKVSFELGSLMFLDLDGFKNINDTLGHDAGDLLLKETAKRLHDCLRDSDSVYRLGGDEFLVLLRKIREKKDAAIVAKNILNTVRMPYYLKLENQSSATVNVGVSVGIVLFSESNLNLNELTQKADLAMYASKNAGKNRFTFYTEEMVQKINERWELEQGLKTALANEELEVHYQPIVSYSGRIIGLEALVRWYHPLMGFIPPEKFIPIAEETNMIIPIGAWVLEQSCLSITNWNSKGYKDIYVTVNLSAIQFELPNIVSSLLSVIKRTACNPANLKLELTETGIMQAPEETIKKMKLLKEKIPEIQIMIDDFGTGYSSLNYLANLPADIFKVDLSFVSRLNDPNNRKVVNSIINLADALEMGYVAEGIETKKQWDFFREKKCQRMQGFLFSKAVKESDVENLLQIGKLPLDKLLKE
ncbi:MAG: EAL domain-containing protein [Spirochaetaceae bacterium]|nr:EAL domain-containing protein [Spirochaetaceae bacterium]